MLFDIERILVAYPTKYEDSMNTILTQEVERFNKLLKRVKASLKDVQRAIIGEMVMSEELESMGNSLVNGLVPSMWSAVSYPSLKPLGPWVLDFLLRLDFITKWVDENSPIVYWISGFFFTQSFLTGTRQNYARGKYSKRRSEHREWSTVVDIFITPSSFKPVLLSLSRISSILKHPNKSFFNPYKYI